MDTSDRSERYFDENSVLYSASNRNSIVCDEGKEKKQDSKDASSEAKTNEENRESSKEEGKTDTEVASAPTDLDSGAEALIKKLKEMGIRQSIATASNHKGFDMKSSGHRDIVAYMDHVICGDDVVEHNGAQLGAVGRYADYGNALRIEECFE
jgi:hypothetical protein